MLTSPKDIGRYWDAILDTMQDALLILSPTGRIISINRAAEVITGYKSSELLGQPCTILECTGCNIFREGPGEKWCELFVKENVAHKRCLVTGKSRDKIHVIKRATILKDEKGEIIGAVESLNDISSEVKKDHEIEKLKQSLAQEEGFHGIIGASASMQRIFGIIEEAAKSDAAVMITGESGTGKELAARAIHKLSPRFDKPFVKVDCVSLNENVMESELFGHVKGAFTGADRSRTGRFEAARGGHVFLDEIGDVPHSIQVKLLRVLEEKVIERVGDHKTIPVDIRIITATNQDLPGMLAEGLFREDLYYRINVVPIELPPLRERREDIPLILDSMVRRLAVRTGKHIEGLDPEAMDRMYYYSWPGNIRELRNALEYAFVVCPEGLIQPAHLPQTLFKEATTDCRPSQSLEIESQSGPKQQLIDALRQANGNQSEAARRLGVSRMTVWKRLKKYGLNIQRDIM